MLMTGEYRIAATRETVWAALNDPEMLRRCIPGCEELEKTSDTGFAAKVKAKVGPVSAKFAGVVTLSDLNPPESYRIAGEGKGGAAGFAKGGATVRLSEDGGETLLSYEVDAQVGGKLAQVGARLIDGTARKLADDFFASLAAEVGQPAAPTAAPEEPAMAHAPTPPPVALPDKPIELDNSDVGAGARLGVWVAGGFLALLLLLAIFGLG